MGTVTRLLGLLAAAAVLTTSLWALEAGQPAPSFDLKDQFGKAVKLSELKGKVVILVAATKDSGELMGPWIDNLKNKYSGRKDAVRVIGLIDLHSIAGLFRGCAISRIKKETNDQLMIDFNGKTAKAYQVSDDYPVVVVIGKDSTVKNIQKTKFSKDSFGAVTAAADQAAQAAAAAPPAANARAQEQ